LILPTRDGSRRAGTSEGRAEVARGCPHNERRTAGAGRSSRSRPPFLLVERGDRLDLVEADADVSGEIDPVAGFLPAIRPELLGDASFRDEHGLRFAYVSGAMANGIGSVEIAQAMARAGMLGIFGAAGLSLRAVENAIDRLEGSPWFPKPLRLQPDPQPERPEPRSSGR